MLNVADELISAVLPHAERLRGCVLAIESGPLEALRWSGALPLLVRDVGVERIVDLEQLWTAVDACKTGMNTTTIKALQDLLGDATSDDVWQADSSAGDREVADRWFVEHLVVVVSDFLYAYEAKLVQLVQCGVVRRLSVGSSLSERAHKCCMPTKVPHFNLQNLHGSVASSMEFDAWAARIAVHNTFEPVTLTVPGTSVGMGAEQAEKRNAGAKINDDFDDDDDEWQWGDETPTTEATTVSPTSVSVLPATSEPLVKVLESSVEVFHVPLNFAPLLATRTREDANDLSLVVCAQPTCAHAFPLLLSHVIAHESKTSDNSDVGATKASGMGYTHVKDVEPQHYPPEFRQSLKLVAHTLAEMVVQMRLDVKERIFAMGATSLKIGHTLQRFVKELEEDLMTHTLQTHEPATVVLIDRVCDLSSPCSFEFSLLDQLLALIPQTPAVRSSADVNLTRQQLHVTDVFPIQGCTPFSSFRSANSVLETSEHTYFSSSAFLARLRWQGGVSLCHPDNARAFRALAFRPAKVALRDLDKQLLEVERELVQQQKISKVGSVKKPGEKVRGRDVVLRRLTNVVEAGEANTLQHAALIDLAILVLETLERMETQQQRWDACRERVLRNIQLRKQRASEWIVPELADTIQRQLMATTATPSSQNTIVSLREVLALIVHAFALSSGNPIEDYTWQMIRNVLSETITRTVDTDFKSIARLLPDLAAELTPYLDSEVNQSAAPNQVANLKDEDEDDDWGWADEHSEPSTKLLQSHAHSTSNVQQRQEIKATAELYVEELLAPLKECAQLASRQHDVEFAASGEEPPRSLVAQICNAILSNCSKNVLPELEHITDASEQLARAGIDLLKSGFSRFGLSTGSSTRHSSSSVLGDSSVLVIFVVGGITFEEVQQVNTILSSNKHVQVILCSTTLTNSDILLRHLFR